MEPYYADDWVTIFHGDNREVLPALGYDVADAVITDPPYSDETHSGARTQGMVWRGDDARISFDSLDGDSLSETLAVCGVACRRWIVATMDWRHIARLAALPPAGLRFVRFGVWVKPNGAPQFTGDRPGPGWEGICFLHREGVPLAWNGGGRSSVWVHNKANGLHPTTKPFSLVSDWVRLFSNPGETVLDPFMGSGTTLSAAKESGRRAIGIEIDERYCEIAATRLSQEVLALA